MSRALDVWPFLTSQAHDYAWVSPREISGYDDFMKEIEENPKKLSKTLRRAVEEVGVP